MIKPEQTIGMKNWKLTILENKRCKIKNDKKDRRYLVLECSCGNIKTIRYEDFFIRNYNTCGDCSVNIYKKSRHGFYYVINRHGNHCLVDSCYITHIDKYSWTMSDSGYFYSNEIREYLHRFIMKLCGFDIDNLEIDHINNRRNDNRIENLRVSNRSSNGMNISIKSNNSSGVTGVYYSIERGKWVATCKMDSYTTAKVSKSTRFALFDEAVQQRVVWESELFKDFSNNYNPQTNTIQLTYHSRDDNQQTFIEVDMNGNILSFEKLSQ